MTHFITRATPIDKIDGKSHKMELKSSHNYSASLNHATSYLWPRGRTRTHTFADKSDYKKPGAQASVPGLKIKIHHLVNY